MAIVEERLEGEYLFKF